MTITKKPTVLVILDGFGYSPNKEYNAIALAKKSTFEYLLAHYPHTFLQADGTAVGLLPGMAGNSEVGHLTIGAGRIVPQPALIIAQAIADHSLATNVILVEQFQKLADIHKTIHIMGLLSDGGVHNTQDFMHACITIAAQQGIKKIVVHAFLDGRDVAPRSAYKYLKKLTDFGKTIPGFCLGSIQGRFYAMDRDNNWDRTQQSYTILTTPQEITFTDWQSALAFYYDNDISDEFIPPTQLQADCIINDADGILFCNYRPDRARQLTSCFVTLDFNHFPIKLLHLTFFITPVSYNSTALKTIELFIKKPLTHTLKDELSAAGKKIVSIAETEKYAHITYFFGGGKEELVPQETRIVIPSIKTHDYSNFPSMSAQEITNTLITSLHNDTADFYLINYANADMVGHSGDLLATIKAIEYLDSCLKKVYEAVVLQRDGTLYITADHGNAEEMFDTKTKQPKTAHTNNPVYFLMIQKHTDKNLLNSLQGLRDIAPLILKHYNLSIPQSML